MKFSRDAWLAAGLVFILLLIAVAASAQQAPTIPYLSTSAAPDGTLALRSWLQALGASTSDEVSSVFQPPQDADLIFVLQPAVQITDSEWTLLDQRIASGATLILAGDSLPSQSAFMHYRFSTTFPDQLPTSLSAQDPLLTSPLPQASFPIRLNLVLVPERRDFVALLAVGGEPVLVSFDQGRGRVILSSTPDPFSNLALKNEATATLVLNLIGLSARHTKVWFDEWHHGLQGSNTISGPDQWLRQSPLGHAVLFIVAVVFLALLLQGRAFGRPVPLPREIRRRSPLEHVTAIANLSRRAGHRDAVLKEYYHRLKRRLAHRYSIDPFLPDAEYVRALAQRNPQIDSAALLDLLTGLARTNLRETEMIRLAANASRWMQDAE